MAQSGPSVPLGVLVSTNDDLLDFWQVRSHFAGPFVEHHRLFSDPLRRIRNQLEIKQWRRVRQIGRGAFGTVYLEEERGGQLRAVKELQKSTYKEKAVDYLREILAMANLSRHDGYFIQLYGWFADEKAIYIAMEFASHGDLQDCVQRCLPEHEVQSITQQIVEALDILHSKNFAHRDLKPSNVFVIEKGPFWWVKLGDLGVSKRVANEMTRYRTSIDTDFTAPEITGFVGIADEEESSYTNAVDVWSLGCLVHWLLTLELPLSRRQMLPYCMKRMALPQQHLNQHVVSDDAIAFMVALLQSRPELRPTAGQMLTQPWLRPPEMKLQVDKRQIQDHNHQGQQGGHAFESLSGSVQQSQIVPILSKIATPPSPSSVPRPIDISHAHNDSASIITYNELQRSTQEAVARKIAEDEAEAQQQKEASIAATAATKKMISESPEEPIAYVNGIAEVLPRNTADDDEYEFDIDAFEAEMAATEEEAARREAEYERKKEEWKEKRRRMIEAEEEAEAFRKQTEAEAEKREWKRERVLGENQNKDVRSAFEAMRYGNASEEDSNHAGKPSSINTSSTEATIPAVSLEEKAVASEQKQAETNNMVHRTEDVENILLHKFPDFADAEKQRLRNNRLRQASYDRTARTNDLLRFSKDFKLKTPVPSDLKPILNNDYIVQQNKAAEEFQCRHAAITQLKNPPPTPADVISRVGFQRAGITVRMPPVPDPSPKRGASTSTAEQSLSSTRASWAQIAAQNYRPVSESQDDMAEKYGDTERISQTSAPAEYRISMTNQERSRHTTAVPEARESLLRNGLPGTTPLVQALFDDLARSFGDRVRWQGRQIMVDSMVISPPYDEMSVRLAQEARGRVGELEPMRKLVGLMRERAKLKGFKNTP